MSSNQAIIAGFGRSETGPVRRSNEDAVLLEPQFGLFAVADGMGGHSAGEVASRLALESLVSFIRRSHDEEECSWPYGVEPTLSYHANRLRTAINLANRRVFRAAESHDEFTGMGSTIAALLFTTGSVVVGHVGDSRAYLTREGQTRQLTQDDTWAVAMLADSDRRSIAAHPMKHVLTNVLGAKETTAIHVSEHPVSAGDRLLLCSDGLHGVFDPTELDQLLADGNFGNHDDAAAYLVSESLSRGTRDNVSAIVVFVGERRV